MKGLRFFALFAFVCEFIGHVHCQELNLVSFGDFMEFHIGFNKACQDVPGGTNVTVPIVSTFVECTHNIGPIKPDWNFENGTSVCQNREKYLGCWEQLKADTLEKCEGSQESLLPAVYPATLASFCGNDNGTNAAERLTKALANIEVDQSCPKETGYDWILNCNDTLSDMHSADLCKRHEAIDKCLGIFACEQVTFARLFRQLYTDARAYLQCD